MPEYESIKCSKCDCHAAWVITPVGMAGSMWMDAAPYLDFICFFCITDENAFNHAISRSSRATVVDAMLPYDEAEQYWERQAKSIRVTSNLNAITAAIKDST